VIRGVGIDLVEIDRFRKTLERRPSLIERIFTESERQYALQRNDPTERFAARFAAKEAALKSMGVGIGAADWHDLEVLRDEDGKPSLNVTGRAATLAADLGITRFELSITHTDSLAQAEVIAIGGAGQRRMSRWRAEAAAGVDAGDSVGRTAWRAPIDPLIAGGLVPIVTPAEMRSIDQEAPEPVEELIARAGSALARHAISMLGGTYGRRVVVLVGSGNNGNDGRDAARRLVRRGVRVKIIEVGEVLGGPDADPVQLPACDLVIDAAFGTGFRGEYNAPEAPPGAMVLAVDVPSGIDGLVGLAGGRVMPADETISFAALKPGLLFGAGAVAAGRIAVVDIGLDVSRATAHLAGASAVAGWLPPRSFDAHKWNSAVCIIAGAPGMEGAAALCARAAYRAGAGYVRLATPGESTMQLPTEVVITRLEPLHWEPTVLPDLGRFRSLVIGNGLGTSPETVASVLSVLAAAKEQELPTVVDADALTALASLGANDARLAAVLGEHAVLTPHDGEFARLAGVAPGQDRISAARELSRRAGSVVLLKGSATVVAAPDGTVLVSNAGDQRLATAGTGDVLAGIIGALLAQGMDPLHAAAAGAFIHGRAGALGWRSGSVAGDLPWRIPGVREELAALLPQR
jgi:NAD(P)H-hydrate epimerase